eukprot:2424552-Rhodomonas_salina.1
MNANVARVFAMLHRTSINNLFPSFDAVAIQLPSAKENEEMELGRYTNKMPINLVAENRKKARQQQMERQTNAPRNATNYQAF